MQKTSALANEILVVAARLFHDVGYDATTFQKIADEVGITKGAITYHFKNKYLIADRLICNYFAQLRAYINEHAPFDRNVYWRRCVMYIFAYRTILGSRPNRELFYHKAQMQSWETSQLETVTGTYRDIATSFHRPYTERSIRFSALLDFGARHRLYQEFCRPGSDITIDDFCYYSVRTIGQLSYLDQTVVEANIADAFSFADSHTPPVIAPFHAPTEPPAATYAEFSDAPEQTGQAARARAASLQITEPTPKAHQAGYRHRHLP